MKKGLELLENIVSNNLAAAKILLFDENIHYIVTTDDKSDKLVEGDTALTAAVRSKSIETLDFVIQNLDSFDVINESSESAFVLACHIGAENIVKHFLTLNIDVDCFNEQLTPAIHAACVTYKEKNPVTILKMLIEKDVSIDQKDASGRTALLSYCIADGSNESVVRLLLEHDADPDAQEDSTPSMSLIGHIVGSKSLDEEQKLNLCGALHEYDVVAKLYSTNTSKEELLQFAEFEMKHEKLAKFLTIPIITNKESDIANMNISGRVTRSGMAGLITIYVIIAILLTSLRDDVTKKGETTVIFTIASSIIVLFFTATLIRATVRRFHDLGGSGLWTILFIPSILVHVIFLDASYFIGNSHSIVEEHSSIFLSLFLGLLLWVIIMMFKGDEGYNQYGNNPKKYNKNQLSTD